LPKRNFSGKFACGNSNTPDRFGQFSDVLSLGSANIMIIFYRFFVKSGFCSSRILGPSCAQDVISSKKQGGSCIFNKNAIVSQSSSVNLKGW